MRRCVMLDWKVKLIDKNEFFFRLSNRDLQGISIGTAIAADG